MNVFDKKKKEREDKRPIKRKDKTRTRSALATVSVQGVQTQAAQVLFLFTCSICDSSGERPPCMQKIFSSTMAATGRQLKQSMNVFHSLMLYLCTILVLFVQRRERERREL